MSAAGDEPFAPWPRSWLFTPAHEERKLAAAARSPAEALIADLEDAVPPERKEQARAAAARFAAGAPSGAPPRIVRINDPRGPHGRADLESLRERPPSAVMVPKAELASLADPLAAGFRSVALLETARGVVEAEDIARLDGVIAIAVGVVDLAAELGLGELADGLELLHVRSRIVLACAIATIPAIDGPYVQVGDDAGLEREARRARALGFAAKLCIHPCQVPAVSSAFEPSAQEIERARAVIDSYERARREGRGAVAADGEMVDLASVRRARRTLGLV